MKFIITLFFLSSNFLLGAQDCYQTFFDAGVQAYESLDFEKAINQFNAAKICDDIPIDNEIDAWIVKTQTGYIDAIRAARDEALQLRSEAIALRFFVKGQEREFKSFYKEAIDEYSSAVKILPRDTLFRERRAQLAMSNDVREYEIAKEDLQFLINEGSVTKQADYEDDLAYVLEQMDDFDGAIAAQTRAGTSAPMEQKVLYNSKVEKLKKNRNTGTKSQVFETSKSNNKAVNSVLKIKPQKGYQNCDLQIVFKIGGKSLKIRRGEINLSKLPAGTYQYEITGKVICPGTPSWPAIGKGTISVRENAVYYLYWELTKYNKCEMWVGNY